MGQDRNFDGIFESFNQRIKNNKKGLLREALIREDLLQFALPASGPSLSILDGGCGLGDMSLWLAQSGHRVLATDISGRMVQHTKTLALEHGVSDRLQVKQASLQETLQSGQTFDLICIHAVMEWLAEPYALIPMIPAALSPSGQLSLTIYNRHRSIFNSLIKGDFQKILAEGDYAGRSNDMTPPNPIEPERIAAALQENSMRVEMQGGLRCFYDYFSARAKDEHSLEDLLILERRFRMLSPYRDFARYVHFIARKS